MGNLLGLILAAKGGGWGDFILKKCRRGRLRCRVGGEPSRLARVELFPFLAFWRNGEWALAVQYRSKKPLSNANSAILDVFLRVGKKAVRILADATLLLGGRGTVD